MRLYLAYLSILMFSSSACLVSSPPTELQVTPTITDISRPSPIPLPQPVVSSPEPILMMQQLVRIDGHDATIQWAERTRLPQGCRPPEVVQLLEKFLVALRQGDQIALAQLFDFKPILNFPPQYLVYAVREKGTQKNDFQARDLDSLLAYFADRHTQREQFELVVLYLSEFWHKEIANLQFSLIREADDIGIYRKMDGIGSIHCTRQKIVGWVMFPS